MSNLGSLCFAFPFRSVPALPALFTHSLLHAFYLLLFQQPVMMLCECVCVCVCAGVFLVFIFGIIIAYFVSLAPPLFFPPFFSRALR